MPIFKIWNAERDNRKAVQASSVEELCRKGREKLELHGALKVVLDIDGTEIDEDSILLDQHGPCAGKDVVLLLLEIGQRWTMKSEEVPPISDKAFLGSLISHHLETLRCIVDPNICLLTKLLAVGLLNQEKYETINEKSTAYNKNDILLPCIKLKTKEDFQNFLHCLQDTEQGHIANYLLANGERLDVRYGLERPLGDEEIRKIIAHGPFMLKHITVDEEFLATLWSRKCITEEHKERIIVQSTNDKKVGELLTILRRRSLASYNNFIEVLHSTKQSHVADALKKPGAVVPSHVKVTVTRSTRDKKSIESDLAAKLDELVRSILSGTTHIHELDAQWEEIKYLWLEMELNGISYKFACQGNSIAVYLWCWTAAAMSHLNEMRYSGQLEAVLIKSLQYLAKETDEVLSFSMKIIEEEWKLPDRYFDLSEQHIMDANCIFGFPSYDARYILTGSGWMSNQICENITDMPGEITMLILMRSFLSLVHLPWKEEFPFIFNKTYSTISSVCYYWRCLLSERTWFVRTLKKYKKRYRHIAILQKHSYIFDQCLDVDYHFLYEMQSLSLITEEQLLEIGIEQDRLKQTEYLFIKVFLKFNGEKYAKFLEILWSTGQGHIVVYLEKEEITDPADHDERPLSDEERGRLNRVKSRLCDFVPSEDFLNRLSSVGCITQFQANIIASLPDCSKSAELIRILKRRSFVALRQFAAHLRTLDEYNVVASFLAADTSHAEMTECEKMIKRKQAEEIREGDHKKMVLELAQNLFELVSGLESGTDERVTIQKMNQIRQLWSIYERRKPVSISELLVAGYTLEEHMRMVWQLRLEMNRGKRPGIDKRNTGEKKDKRKSDADNQLSPDSETREKLNKYAQRLMKCIKAEKGNALFAEN